MPKVTLQEMLKTCVAQVIAAYEQLTEEQQVKVDIQMFSQTDRPFSWIWAVCMKGTEWYHCPALAPVP